MTNHFPWRAVGDVIWGNMPNPVLEMDVNRQFYAKTLQCKNRKISDQVES